MIDRVLCDVLRKVPLDAPRAVTVLGEAPNVVIRGQKPDIRRALEQVADQHVDDHLGPRPGRQECLLLGLRCEVGHEIAGERLERLAGTAQVGTVLAEVRQEGKAVPCPLQRGKAFAIADYRRHVLG